MCGEAFAPLVFLVRRDPLRARGLYPIRDLSELDEPEGIGCLTPSSPAEGELAAFVRAHGAGVLNAAFSRAFSILQAWSAAKKDGLVLTLVGLGDVGGTALLALKLLGRELAEVQIFDPNRAQCQRYEMELNQVLSADGRTLPEVVICEEQDLFRCDLFAFTASRGVPGLDTKVQDVRMAQYEANRAMVGSYARMARQADFTGLFCQISDPVDHLSRSVFLQSNQKETGEFDFAGLLPEQVQGFGLGVMAARCAYYARQLGLDEDALRVYGPHGQGLVCANCCGGGYDAAISAELTEKDPHGESARAGAGLQAVSRARALLRGGKSAAARARAGALRRGAARQGVFRLRQPHDALRPGASAGGARARAPGGAGEDLCGIGGVRVLMETLTLVRIGRSARLERLLPAALAEFPVTELPAEQIASAAGRRLLFAVAVDAYGPDEAFVRLLRTLRQNPDCLCGCIGGVIVDGAGELDTKQLARQLVLTANLAGCAFPGKPLVEGTGSLYNQHIQAGLLHLSWEQTYAHQMAQLAGRLLRFRLPRFERPKLLMLHASDNRRSNTVWLGEQVLQRLPSTFETKTISLQNGSIHDCRGCSYEACLHFAAQSRCFYGGSISDDVLPAISRCDAMLFLCPNYNDAVSANLMALFNRLTNLLVRQDLYEKYLYGIVVSGYSGSDIVARQLLGAMCLNKTAILPPEFCLMQTAHDPGSVQKADGIDAQLSAFAARLGRMQG